MILIGGGLLLSTKKKNGTSPATPNTEGGAGYMVVPDHMHMPTESYCQCAQCRRYAEDCLHYDEMHLHGYADQHAPYPPYMPWTQTSAGYRHL